ncbi:MAG: phytoene desaturase [Saprospiraceae bacterium]|nr:phytoene desaturase [Bacteroidia bacterium]NNL93520.1 phytoene desaturase [Saprospiraceae bacterium]
MKKVTIIGSGIAGLSAASVLSSKGFDVTVIEKNDKPGGRINYFDSDGYRFEMGPSWYWMPEVFENFYKIFGKTTSDFYNLKRLDPSYKVVFTENETIDIPADFQALQSLFESIEKGSGQRLKKFMDHAEIKYKVGMDKFVWKPGKSVFEFMSFDVVKNALKLQLLSSISSEVKKVVADDRLRQILEFPVLFLGAEPKDTPALYSLMNHADLKLGTWYPEGGMYKIAEAFYKIAISQGVKFKFNQPVTHFNYNKNAIKEVCSNNIQTETDFVIANADYHYIDQEVLSQKFSSYNSKYWQSRKMAPSSLLVFLGVNKKLEKLEHHNLFFDADFDKHAIEIYKDPKWPTDPLFYVCKPSHTDNSVAPSGKENLFLLMPIAPDLSDDDNEILEKYLDVMISRIEKQCKTAFKDQIEFKKFFSVKDFKSVYNSFKGNAYGLANTLNQTAILKPSIKSKKLSNLYFTGQLTVPGPGLPPSIISGQLVAQEVINNFK